MPRRLIPIVALILASATPAPAHQLDHSSKHGGIIAESGHHHLEVVAKDGTIEVHVAGEDGKPEDLTGAKATAAILSEGKKIDVELAPNTSGVFSGAGEFKAGKGTIIIVTMTMADHKPEQVRVKLD